MKVVRFLDQQGQTRTGRLVTARAALALSAAPKNKPQLRAVNIERFLPPVEPPNIFGIGRNYAAHVVETGAQVPEEPLVFAKATTSLVGHEGEIILPEAAPDEVDFEAELAVVIGSTMRNVPPEEALEYVAGYTCANDVSARACQRRDRQWTRAKSFDTFCPLGPWLVTADEIDPDRLRIRSRLNGQVMQDANTSSMIFSCRQLLSYLSHQFTLLPDTVILTGTPGGVGFTRQPPVYLRSGDLIEVEIEGIGTLANRVRRA